MKNRAYYPAKRFIENTPKLELRDLPPHMSYVFSGKFETVLVIIVADLNGRQIKCLLSVLMWFKRAIGWTIAVLLVSLLKVFLTKSKS